jgi:23S rRNA pseudouridine955/2504/2580 synthase
MEVSSFIVGANEAGCRLDRVIRKRLALQSLSAIYKLIRTGRIRIDGKKAHNDDRLTEGSTVSLSVPASEIITPGMLPDDLVKGLVRTDFFTRNFCVVYEDESLLACNKPCGLVVHPGSGHEEHTTLVDLAYSYLLDKNPAAEKPELVHRLDRDTSGVILLAKTKPVLRVLHEQLRGHDLHKEYRAICYGSLPKIQDTLESDLVKTYALNDGTKMKVSREDEEESVHARLSYRVIGSNDSFSKLTIVLYTGRTHQIRVQLVSIGCPLVGDVRYGDASADDRLFKDRAILRRLYLHAYRVGFVHPVTGKKLLITAKEPPEFNLIIK